VFVFLRAMPAFFHLECYKIQKIGGSIVIFSEQVFVMDK